MSPEEMSLARKGISDFVISGGPLNLPGETIDQDATDEPLHDLNDSGSESDGVQASSDT